MSYTNLLEVHMAHRMEVESFGGIRELVTALEQMKDATDLTVRGNVIARVIPCISELERKNLLAEAQALVAKARATSAKKGLSTKQIQREVNKAVRQVRAANAKRCS